MRSLLFCECKNYYIQLFNNMKNTTIFWSSVRNFRFRFSGLMTVKPFLFAGLLGMALSTGCIRMDGETIRTTMGDLRYTSLQSELLDSIGFSFFDSKRIIYRRDSTLIVYPDGDDLKFYLVEEKRDVAKIDCPVHVENARDFSVESLSDVVIFYGEALVRIKDGNERIIDLPKFTDFAWLPETHGFEYFSDLDLVVTGLQASWTDDDNSANKMNGLVSFNLKTNEMRHLPFTYDNIYRNKDSWGAEIALSKSGNNLIISENWSEKVHVVNMETLEMNSYPVRHPAENIANDLPRHLSDHKEFIPGPEERVTERYALWKLRHHCFEKYGKAFLSASGDKIYRLYQHRITPTKSNTGLSQHQKAQFIVRTDLLNGESVVYPVPSNRFFVWRGFWLTPEEGFQTIKFLYKSHFDRDDAVYLLETIELFDYFE
ncbi:MAG: hypothetical protein EA392_09610 [Cryomorphaceae bacterium]|nr:MAG: hypothetical protein EA392_09610 [Cryomorphaceae bacterium]